MADPGSVAFNFRRQGCIFVKAAEAEEDRVQPPPFPFRPSCLPYLSCPASSCCIHLLCYPTVIPSPVRHCPLIFSPILLRVTACDPIIFIPLFVRPYLIHLLCILAMIRLCLLISSGRVSVIFPALTLMPLLPSRSTAVRSHARYFPFTAMPAPLPQRPNLRRPRQTTALLDCSAAVPAHVFLAREVS